VQALVFAGFSSSPDASKTGIISTTAQNDNGKEILALFDNSLVNVADWPPGSGHTIAANAVVGKYTYFGDLNMDGQVTGDDYAVIDSNLGNGTASPLGARGAPVPEPATLFSLAAIALAGVTRRYRRNIR